MPLLPLLLLLPLLPLLILRILLTLLLLLLLLPSALRRRRRDPGDHCAISLLGHRRQDRRAHAV